MTSYTQILDIAGYIIYFALGAAAVYGVFLVTLLIRRISQKRFASQKAEADFTEAVHEFLNQGDLEGLALYCDSPGLWRDIICQ